MTVANKKYVKLKWKKYLKESVEKIQILKVTKLNDRANATDARHTEAGTHSAEEETSDSGKNNDATIVYMTNFNMFQF